MTNEEAYKICCSIKPEHIEDLTIQECDAMHIAVEALLKEITKQELPDDVDKAAEEFCRPRFDDGTEHTMEIVTWAFRAGAEWMAKQGETVEGEIVCAVAYPHENKVIARVYGDYRFGDKVIVQIRKI